MDYSTSSTHALTYSIIQVGWAFCHNIPKRKTASVMFVLLPIIIKRTVWADWWHLKYLEHSSQEDVLSNPTHPQKNRWEDERAKGVEDTRRSRSFVFSSFSTVQSLQPLSMHLHVIVTPTIKLFLPLLLTVVLLVINHDTYILLSDCLRKPLRKDHSTSKWIRINANSTEEREQEGLWFFCHL